MKEVTSSVVEAVKKAIRRTDRTFDNEIKDTVYECLTDLETAGIDTEKTPHLINKALKLFAKADVDFNNKGDGYKKAYEELRNKLKLLNTGEDDE